MLAPSKAPKIKYNLGPKIKQLSHVESTYRSVPEKKKISHRH